MSFFRSSCKKCGWRDLSLASSFLSCFAKVRVVILWRSHSFKCLVEKRSLKRGYWMKKLIAVLETRSFDLMNTFFSPFPVNNIKLYSRHEPNIWVIKGKLGFIESCNSLKRPMLFFFSIQKSSAVEEIPFSSRVA